MNRSRPSQSTFAIVAVLVATAASCSRTEAPVPRSVSLATMARIATVDQRCQSYNVEMAEVIGGNFWKPYDPHVTVSVPATTPAPAGATLEIGQGSGSTRWPMAFRKSSPPSKRN